MCDGLSSGFAVIFGVLPNTSFSQNVGLATMAKVINRLALFAGATIMPQAVPGGDDVFLHRHQRYSAHYP